MIKTKSIKVSNKISRSLIHRIITYFIGFLAIFLAIFFYLQAQKTREFMYYVHPVKATVVKSGQVSSLSVSYDDREIQTDITATQLYIWNAGKESIKDNNILKPITILTENNAPILEATIMKESRDVVKLKLNQNEIQRGILPITWNILEQNDGGIIQLIHAGEPETKILFEGVIEGQKKIKELRFPREIKSAAEQYTKIAKEHKFFGFTFLGLAVIMFITYILFYTRKFPFIGRIRKEKPDEPRDYFVFDRIMLIMIPLYAIFLFVMSWYYLLIKPVPVLPF